ncbi:MAG: GtrA family protein [Paludibacteraceae bacterium]|nr:GtrA family protein [Paludibacteraceae bacterium]
MIDWKTIRNSQTFNEFIRFAIVGCIAAAIHYGLYLLLLWAMGLDITLANGIGIKANIAYTIGYMVSLVCNMVLTARFTFREHLSVKRGTGFLLSHGINYLLHMGLLNLYLWLGVPDWLTFPLVLVIAVPINFILVRTAFKKL